METFILVILSNGDVYRQVKRSGALIALGQVGRLYAGLAVDNPIFNSVGASRYRIYCIFLSGSQEGLPNLDGGTLRSKAGTGKGTGKFWWHWTGQKTVSGTTCKLKLRISSQRN
jgi:hypothetical protein